MAATINGAPINFGFQGTAVSGLQGISITGITGYLQSLEYSRSADVEVVKDGNGNEVVHAWSNQKRAANLELIVSGASLAATLTGVSTMLQAPGTLFGVSSCTSQPGLVGVSWEVKDSKVSHSNTTAAKLALSLESLTDITGAAS